MKSFFPSLFSAINNKFGGSKKTQTVTEVPSQNTPSAPMSAEVSQQHSSINMSDDELKKIQEKADKLKHQFMANMSHEIRTPMNAIVGMSRLLLEKNPNAEQLRYLNAIQLSANNLMGIINDLLDITKIEAGKVVIAHDDFTFRDLLDSIQDMFMLKAEEKDLKLKITTDAAIPVRLNGDEVRLNQILINLVGNAIKFTEKGSVELKSTLMSGTTDLVMRFDVIDTGIGIAPENMETIFDSFIQEGMDSNRKYGGAGLGLTICKELAVLMGGDISVKSVLGEGTTFTLHLPFKAAVSQDIPVIHAHASHVMSKRLENLRVLLVEDNDFNRLVAVDTLKENLKNVQVDQAINGEEAVNMVKKNTYDVVLMDIQMPVMDGVTATKIIRGVLEEPAKSVNILALTANVLQEDLVKYFDVGIDDYVAKPFQVDELMAKLEKVLSKKLPLEPSVQNGELNESTAVVEAQNIIHESSVVNQEAYSPIVLSVSAAGKERLMPEYVTDKDFLKSFTGGNPDRMRKYVKMFMENATKLLISMDLALQAKDYSAIKIAAHSLKPQLSYMGVKEDVSHIFMIEQSAGSSAHYDNLEEEIQALNKVCNKAFEELRHLLY